jgi:hypothetical protein
LGFWISTWNAGLNPSLYVDKGSMAAFMISMTLCFHSGLFEE